MTDFPKLETERLLLRNFIKGDAPTIQELANEWEIASNTISIPFPYVEGLALKWISTHEKEYRTCSSIIFAITLKPESNVLGAVGLKLFTTDQKAEIGYWIGKPYWNNGYCTEAVRATIEYCFKVMSLHRVYAKVFTKNQSSCRVLEKAGFEREGCLKHDVMKLGKFEDIYIYGILRINYFTDC